MLKKLTDLRIQWKMIFGFLLVSGITIAAGAIAGVGVMHLRENLRIVYEDYTVAGTDLARASTSLLRYRNNILLAMAAQDQAAVDKHLAQQEALKEGLTKSLDAYAATVLRLSRSGRDEARDLRSVREALAQYFPAAETTMALIREAVAATSKEKAEAAIAKAKVNAAQNAGPKLLVVMVAIEELVETVREVAKDMNEDGTTAGFNALAILAVGICAATVIGLSFGYWMACLVDRNIRSILDAAKKIAAGDLSARAAVEAKDEIGHLANVFNEMGRVIQADVDAASQYEATFEAVSKAQAVIEFSMDGTILKANDNFLMTMGYSHDEVKGQHHRMFCEPAYASSPAYAEFWTKLNRGQAQIDTFRRLGKGGKEVWIQASYNPIPDARGKLIKVVEFASDVTEEKQKALVKYATDTSTSNVLMCDRNLVITYINAAAQARLKHLEGEVRKVFPSFNAEKIVGVCIDQFHQVPDKQRRLLADPKNLPHRAEIKLGPLTLALTVSAIMTDRGEYLGNTLEWADITSQKKAQVEVDRLITAAAEGQLNERIDAAGFEGFFKDLSEGVNKMLDAVVTPLHEAQQVLTSLADNNLTKSMSGSYQGEFEQMKTSLNQALGNLAATVGAVREAVEAVSNGAEEITKGNEDLAQRTSEQAGSLEETSASMEEMTSTVKQNADNAKQANQLAIAARETADKGGAVTIRAVEAMGEINQSSKKIADIITVIDEIAFQTNLLALNAAVEAARAGEHGRGFAVVAAEVRNLAQRSATAAKEIKGLINESIQRVNDGSELVNQSGKTLEEIVASVKRVTDIIAEITAASQEQASGIDQVNKAIMQMDETTQQNAALVEETTSASQSMKEQAKELMRQVAVFKVSGTGSAPPRAVPVRAQQRGQAPRGDTKKGDSPRSAKKEASPQPAAVAAGNGHDRRAKGDEFEEF